VDVQDLFPNLTRDNHRKTSECTRRYNCVAWALGFDNQWWEPISAPGYYWPGSRHVWTVDGYANVFTEHLGFHECGDGALEHGFDKIAIYGEGNDFLHVARQLPEGNWTSKLGRDIDIEHESVEALAGPEYGTVKKYMKRLRDHP